MNIRGTIMMRKLTLILAVVVPFWGCAHSRPIIQPPTKHVKAIPPAPVVLEPPVVSSKGQGEAR